jgi:CRISPR/Cas system CMR-associated protein Cmr1 (group 7 of RAMP superfamily)
MVVEGEDMGVKTNISHFDEGDDLKRFEELFEKLVKENKIDKNLLLKKLKIVSVLEEGGESQFNDMLLDE